MKVEFDATLDDFVDLANRIRERSKEIRSFRRASIVFFAALTGFAVSTTGFGSFWNKVLAGCIGVLIFGALFVVLRRITYPLDNLRIRRIYREQLETEGPIKVEVEIAESGILVRQGGTQIEFGWESVKTIEERGDSIEIWKSGGPLIVRGRAFDSKAQRSEFLDLCKKWTKLSQASSATQSDT